MLAIAHVVTIDPAALSYAAGFVVPVLVAILAKQSAPAPMKAVLNAILVCVAALIAVAIKQEGHLDLYGWGTSIAEAAVASWASYYGFWKPTNIAPSIHTATGGFGIG
jgi:hypothetical protein